MVWPAAAHVRLVDSDRVVPYYRSVEVGVAAIEITARAIKGKSSVFLGRMQGKAALAICLPSSLLIAFVCSLLRREIALF